MTEKLLTKQDCAECRLCCHFDSYGLLETPVITEDTQKLITAQYLPEQQFAEIGGRCLMKMEKEPDRDIYTCPLLEDSKGCMLGDAKPFDCRIFPFLLMKLSDIRVIALSPACPKVQSKPLTDIQSAAKDIAPTLFDYADRYPEAVRSYIHGYPIILTEEIKR